MGLPRSGYRRFPIRWWRWRCLFRRKPSSASARVTGFNSLQPGSNRSYNSRQFTPRERLLAARAIRRAACRSGFGPGFCLNCGLGGPHDSAESAGVGSVEHPVLAPELPGLCCGVLG